MTQKTTPQMNALVDAAWINAHAGDPEVCLIEIAGMGQDHLQAYHAGHVPGSRPWQWQETLWDSHRRDFPSPGEFARRLGAAGIGNKTNVVFYGEGMQFGIYAWWVFRYCGHQNTYVLDGARHHWAVNGTLSKEPPPSRPACEYSPVSRREDMRVLRGEVMCALERPETLLLDARTVEEYAGLRVAPLGGTDDGAIRYGRIPGARHLYFGDLLDANQHFKSGQALRLLMDEHGVTANLDIIAYCRLSHRATVLYFALTELLGLHNVRLYDGSWTEWGNLVGVPVER